tara:strand:- start:1035 stop:1223 length:189 start_codon:yes stop_codon:yes gene_type:complete
MAKGDGITISPKEFKKVARLRTKRIKPNADQFHAKFNANFLEISTIAGFVTACPTSEHSRIA